MPVGCGVRNAGVNAASELLSLHGTFSWSSTTAQGK